MQYHYKEGYVYNARGKKLGTKCNSGYIKVTIGSGSRKNKKNWYAHRWIWTHFNGDIPNGYEIHHRDSNKENNNIDNLKLVAFDPLQAFTTASVSQSNEAGQLWGSYCAMISANIAQ